jgi:hypothetical protein
MINYSAVPIYVWMSLTFIPKTHLVLDNKHRAVVLDSYETSHELKCNMLFIYWCSLLRRFSVLYEEMKTIDKDFILNMMIACAQITIWYYMSNVVM